MCWNDTAVGEYNVSSLEIGVNNKEMLKIAKEFYKLA